MTTIYHCVIDYYSDSHTDSMYVIWFYLFQHIYDKINDFNLKKKK